MNSTQVHRESTIANPRTQPAEMKIEVIVIPVSDVDRAKRFYSELGWRLDLDIAASDEYRAVQFTPPGSSCSIMFGRGITTAAPGSAQGLHIIVSDIVAARTQLVNRGIDVSEPFHDPGGLFHHASRDGIRSGLQPQRRSYGSYASLTDPDGNGWVLQEVTGRLLGDVDTGGTLTSMMGLQRALERAGESNSDAGPRICPTSKTASTR
jgi:catechol 2,3-dioxygenase-like lactoylglutathione lyase family enzyme